MTLGFFNYKGYGSWSHGLVGEGVKMQFVATGDVRGFRDVPDGQPPQTY